MREFALRKYVNLGQPLSQVLLDIGNLVSIADSQKNVHRVLRPETHVTGGIPVRGEQKRDAQESSVPLNLALDARTLTIDLPFCRQRREIHLFAIAYVVE